MFVSLIFVYTHIHPQRNALQGDNGVTLLSDFGASFFYDKSNVAAAAAIQATEKRALGIFCRVRACVRAGVCVVCAWCVCTYT